MVKPILTLKQKQHEQDTEQLINLMSGQTIIIIPRKLTLFGIEYCVKVQKSVLSEGKSVNGYINHQDKAIYLKERNGMDKTFIHEVIHARDNFFGLKRNVPETEKESLVKMESEWWTQFFRQIFPVGELIRKTDIRDKKHKEREQIKELRLEIERKDKQIKTLKSKLKEVKK